jgi:hypothetical protein
MVTAALVSFALLAIGWIVAPDRHEDRVGTLDRQNEEVEAAPVAA